MVYPPKVPENRLSMKQIEARKSVPAKAAVSAKVAGPQLHSVSASLPDDGSDILTIYMDSGAGQCMTSCAEAFHTLQACAVMIIGVGGSMPAHGIGTANFVGVLDGIEYIVTIHNCLLCHGEDGFNLLSVSQILRQPRNSVVFRWNASHLEIQVSDEMTTRFDLHESEGLYEMKLSPLYMDDWRMKSAERFEITLEHDSKLWGTDGGTQTLVDMKSPTKLGKWHSKMLWMSIKMAPMRGISSGYDEDLLSF